MKKIVASVGLVALGASTINVLHAQDISSAPAKAWNVSVSLRGFYDDNINGLEDKTGSLGFSVMPGIGLSLGNDQTVFKAGYNYAYRYYDKRRIDANQNYDQTHTFDLTLLHNFSERFSVAVGDTFAIGQEPDSQRTANGAYTQLLPVSGDNLRNYGSVYFTAEITPVLSAEVGYANEWVDFADDNGTVGSPSNSGLLDRIGQTISLEGQWKLAPQTTGLLGYNYNMENYTGDEPIGFDGVNVIMSDARDADSHYGYVGVDHIFRPDFSGGLRGGVRYTSYPNDPEGSNGKTSPYVKGNLRYAYTVQSYAELGVSYDRSPTEVHSQSGDPITKDAQSFVVFGSIHHQFTPRVQGNLVGQVQNSTLNGGTYDSDNQLYYNFGVNMTYKFNANFSGELGYSFDALDSDVPGYDYNRNRVYLGVTATY